jgi:hypothetical protein
MQLDNPYNNDRRVFTGAETLIEVGKSFQVLATNNI